MERSLEVKIQYIVDQLGVTIDAMECELVINGFTKDQHIRLKAKLDAYVEIQERLIELFGDVIYQNN